MLSQDRKPTADPHVLPRNRSGRTYRSMRSVDPADLATDLVHYRPGLLLGIDPTRVQQSPQPPDRRSNPGDPLGPMGRLGHPPRRPLVPLPVASTDPIRQSPFLALVLAQCRESMVELPRTTSPLAVDPTRVQSQPRRRDMAGHPSTADPRGTQRRPRGPTRPTRWTGTPRTPRCNPYGMGHPVSAYPPNPHGSE